MHIAMHASAINWYIYYPAYKLSQFSSKCQEGIYSKWHFTWIIPTQIVCTAITIPLLIAATTIHFIMSVFFLIMSMSETFDPYSHVQVSEERRKNYSETQNFEDREFFKALKKDYPNDTTSELQTLYNKKISKIYRHDVAVENLLSIADSYVFSALLIVRIFYPHWKSNFTSLSMDKNDIASREYWSKQEGILFGRPLDL